jgi:ABC-type multidrug transport system ATPase subunit
LGGDLLESRTVLLVTHNVVLAEQISDFVVILGLDGKVTSQGSMSEALKSNSRLRRSARKQSEEIARAEVKEDSFSGEKDATTTGKLIVEEEVDIGHVSWKAGLSTEQSFEPLT